MIKFTQTNTRNTGGTKACAPKMSCPSNHPQSTAGLAGCNDQQFHKTEFSLLSTLCSGVLNLFIFYQPVVEKKMQSRKQKTKLILHVDYGFAFRFRQTIYPFWNLYVFYAFQLVSNKP